MGARIGVIGAGQVGAAAAYLLSGTAGVSDVVLVDVNTARAAGEAADIGHAAAFGNASANTPYIAILGEPRTFGLTLTGRY